MNFARNQPQTLEDAEKKNKTKQKQKQKKKTNKTRQKLKIAACLKTSGPVGLQWRPRPLIRSDEQFAAAYNKISQKAEQELVELLLRQQ